jgi:S-adenosylmethionine synthetase
MEITKDDTLDVERGGVGNNLKPIRPDFFENLWEESWTFIKTVVDIVREPVLILDKDFKVMAANESFYRTFQVEQKDTESRVVYELGNGQWNIPDLKKLLEDILPKNTFFKGFEVAYEFPMIGQKVMILNARQIHFKENTALEVFPPIILLAMEDVTEMMAVAETLAKHTNHLETKLTERTHKLEVQIEILAKEIIKLKKDIPNA